jgi:hypothetical protein
MATNASDSITDQGAVYRRFRRPAWLAITLCLAPTIASAQDSDWPREIPLADGTALVYLPQVDSLTRDVVFGRAAVSITRTGQRRQRRTAPLSAAGGRLDRWSENHCAANRATSSTSIVVKTISPNRRDCPDTREVPQKWHVSCRAPSARPQRGQVFSGISLHAPTTERLEKALDCTGGIYPPAGRREPGPGCYVGGRAETLRLSRRHRPASSWTRSH